MQITQTLEDIATGDIVTTDGFGCEYFAKCTNDATAFVSHPILEWVPACDRCIVKLESM